MKWLLAATWIEALLQKSSRYGVNLGSFTKPHEGVLLLLSCFSRVRLCATPQTAAHQALPSLGFSRQEHWSGLPFPSPMHESEKWNWSRSVVSNPQRPHGLQPTRLLRPWDFPGKSTGVGASISLLLFRLKRSDMEHQNWPKLVIAHYSVFPISINGQGEIPLFNPIWKRLWNGLSFSKSGSRPPLYDQLGEAVGRLDGVSAETSGTRVEAVAAIFAF